MPETAWTLTELVAEATARIAALPAPKNGQVRAVPDERTVRYYGTIGLLDRPIGARGRTALYGARHLAQIVAIKRLQSANKSLAEIRALWPTIDAPTLSRMSGVDLPKAARAFWKSAPQPVPVPVPVPDSESPDAEPIHVRIAIAPGTTLLVTLQLIQEPTP